ncbi:MAG: tRNA (adenosine(37)-N6)-threonylcarbamoyltransferase complex dimerization subunit type 1 TsaB [Bacteroidia bacterium]
MAIILLMETSTEVCSVGLAKDGEIIGIKENFEGNKHASQLHVLVDELLNELQLKFNDLQAIAISKGPGSYTGLRVGVSSAKGYCFGLNIPLIAIGTLESLKNQAIKKYQNENTFQIIPMLDARRMEVYCGVWNQDSKILQEIEAKILDEKSFASHLNQSKTVFVGTGIQKFKAICGHQHAMFDESIYCSVKGMAKNAEESYQSGIFEDLAYFEPFYLKDFVGTTPKKALHKS